MNEEAAAVGRPDDISQSAFLSHDARPAATCSRYFTGGSQIMRFRSDLFAKKTTRNGASPPRLIDSRFFAESSRGSQSPAALEQVCRNAPFLAHYCLF